MKELDLYHCDECGLELTTEMATVTAFRWEPKTQTNGLLKVLCDACWKEFWTT